MELRRLTWIAALKLACVVSLVGAVVAIAASSIGGVPDSAIVLGVVFVAFVASWVQSGRILRRTTGTGLMAPIRSVGVPSA